MLFGSNFIINCSERSNQFTIYPFVHSLAYYYNEEDVFRSVTIPDRAPIDHLVGEPDFNIVGGEFTFVYNQRPNCFDGMASCFFLDTANNIFEYVDTVWTTLKPGAVWVNFGPLLFHYKEMLNEVSIEISWETLRAYIALKFEFLEEGFKRTTYCHDPKSDLSVVYNCISFVCRKREAPSPLLSCPDI
jgi:carnosine N-methyltransferase